MRRFLAIGVAVAMINVGVLLTGCSAQVAGTAAKLAVASSTVTERSATSGGGWYGTVPGIALFLQWARVGPNVTGSIKATVNYSGTVKTSDRAFTGVIGGGTIVLTFTEASSSATANSLTGSLTGADVTLNWPSDDGTLSPLVLKAGSIEDFNRIVATATEIAIPQTAATSTFDATKVAAGVTKILTDAPPNGYGATGVSDVTCPPNQLAVAGSTFTCTATVNGSPKSIVITVKDSKGTYEVGVPS